MYKQQTPIETSNEQAPVSSINNTNITNKKNSSNLEKHTKNFKEINNTSENSVIPNGYPELVEGAVEGTQKEKSAAKKEMFSTFADSEKNQTKKNQQKESDDFVIPSCHPELVEGAVEGTQTKKSQQKDESCHTELVEVPNNQISNPTIEEVKTFFQQNNFPELEAQKFFNYFSSNGWLVGGKTPMKNWKAAAQNWILNSISFKNTTINYPPSNPNHLTSTTNKNYAEPL